MSSIKLESNASGTGIFTIASPNSNTNRTLTLPDATGTIITTAGGAAISGTTGAFTTTVGVGGATPAASGAGITFPATQSASTNANTLDDYEEGTWTGTLTSGGGSITANAVAGTYTKVGRMVTVCGRFSVTSVSSPTGDVTLTGLPFANNTGVSFESAISIMSDGLQATATTMIMGVVGGAETHISIYKYAAGVASSMASDIKAGSVFRITATYQTT